jgi:20S proteasome subunit alpha 5
MSVESCTQAICDLALRFGEDRKSEKAMVHSHLRLHASFASSSHALELLRPSSLLFSNLATIANFQSRPFGVALLVAGVDSENGPALFHTDPSGTFVLYEA